MLMQLRDYIQHQSMVSMQQLAREFQIDPSALQPMLDIWINKNVIARHVKVRCQGSCTRCVEWYTFKSSEA